VAYDREEVVQDLEGSRREDGSRASDGMFRAQKAGSRTLRCEKDLTQARTIVQCQYRHDEFPTKQNVEAERFSRTRGRGNERLVDGTTKQNALAEHRLGGEVEV
jgi:hypothetical protein